MSQCFHHSAVQEYRKVPIFPELRPYLEEAYEMSKVGAEWVIAGVESFDTNRANPSKPNLRRSALRSLKKAGITPWPDLMVNLRKTRQIELTDIHPQHVVCAWLGNSEDVAKKHYLKVTDGHMSAGSLLRASQKAGPELAVMPSHAVSAKSQTLENKAYHVMSYHDMPAIGGQVGDEGLELLPYSAGSRSICLERDAESDAYLHEKVVVEQFKLLQPLLSTELKQSLIAELVASLVER